MKIIRKNETKKFQNSADCIAIEYPLGDKDINGSVIRLNGRYPETGTAHNTLCKEMAHIIRGEGKIVIEGDETIVTEGDVILIDPTERYHWEGNLEMFVSCTPAWTPEQHKIITT